MFHFSSRRPWTLASQDAALEQDPADSAYSRLLRGSCASPKAELFCGDLPDWGGAKWVAREIPRNASGTGSLEAISVQGDPRPRTPEQTNLVFGHHPLVF